MANAYLVRLEQVYFKKYVTATAPTFVSTDPDLGQNGLDTFNTPGSAPNREIPGRTAAPEFQNSGKIIRELEMTIDLNATTKFLRDEEGEKYLVRRYQWEGTGTPSSINATSAGGSGWRREEFDVVLADVNPVVVDDEYRGLEISGNVSGAVTVTQS